MYDYLRGQVVQAEPSRVVVDVGGVGYVALVPLGTYEAARDALHRREPFTLYVRLQMLSNQDELRLYGFSGVGERRLFDALVTVQGVGPQSALALLSGSSAADVVHAIRGEDMRFLMRAKGIGKKTAQRVVVELKEKAHQLMPAPAAGGTGAADDPGVALGGDAVRALVALGYAVDRARRAVDKALKDLAPDPPIEDLVRAALRLA